MKTFYTTIFSIIFLGFSASAQFPGGGGGFGGFGGGKQEKQVKLPGTADDDRPRGTGKISGVVMDSTTNKPVEFANVAILDPKTKKPIDGAMADDRGRFSLKNVAAGDWVLSFNFLGLRNTSIPVKIEKKGTDINLASVFMSPDIKMLKEVNITGTASLIEEKVDRLVYNAEKDVTSKGGDATEVLKKVPMLSVDLDGNVSLRGSSNIRVLINNKPSTIVASSVADALKQIPAEMIKTVEVITSPSAKYDAEGSGGIINIITKKSTLQGLTLNFDSGVGLRGSNLGLNANFRQGKFGLSLGGHGRASYVKSASTLEQITNRNGGLLTNQTATGRDNSLMGFYNLGLDYDLGKNQSLTAGVRFGTRGSVRTQDFVINQLTNYYGFENKISSTNYRDVSTTDRSNSVDVNLDYLRTFKASQELSFSSQYSINHLTNNFDADLLKANTSGDLLLNSRQKNINGNTNAEFTFQGDYQAPIGESQLFEVGLKTIIRQVNSNYKYQIAGATGDFATDAKNPSGLLDYTQNIKAAYISYTYSTPSKYTFKLGTRYEHTAIDAKDQIKAIVIQPYSNFVPSVNISKKFGNLMFKLAYNNRIQRPGLQQLNPNFNAANPQNISIGNPNLKPEISDNVELSTSTNIGKTYLNLSVFGRFTNNAINRISTPSDTLAGAVVTTFQNIGTQRTYGTNLFGNVNITPKWSVNGGFDLINQYMEGQVQDATNKLVTINNQGWILSGRMNTQLQLNGGWGIQANGGMRGRQVMLQGTQGSFYMYSFGVRKDFKNKKGSLGLAADNFVGGLFVRSTTESALFTQNTTLNNYNQNIKLTFSYKIGKMIFVEKKKTKSVKNDDVKDGGGQ